MDIFDKLTEEEVLWGLINLALHVSEEEEDDEL